MTTPLGARLIDIIQNADPSVRDLSVRATLQGSSFDEILEATRVLERFRQTSGNLYERVRVGTKVIVI